MCLKRLVSKIMARKIDPRDFLLNTDYEMDKIVYFTKGSLEEGQSSNIPHKLNFAPLVFGVFAFNSDFSDPKTLPFQQITPDNTIAFTLFANSSVVQIGYGNYADHPPTAYYRIYGFEPSDSHSKVGATSKFAQNFLLNTDYNYCKLYKKGIVNGDATIAHNLGYIPQVLAWKEDGNGLITPVENIVLDDPFSNNPSWVRVTSSEINFKNTGKVHYRIYYDEA